MDDYTKRKFYEALTRYNYFPNQKSSIGELPPIINTRQFTPEVCEALAALDEPSIRRKSGYDVVTYNATRYNNAFRELSLIHPKAYSLLAKHLHDHWEQIAPFTASKSSIIKPEEHEDGRIMVMNYEDPIQKTTRTLKESFAKRYQVKADISNCFNSIYSHAIAWGLAGFEHAKANQQPDLWFNLMDIYQRKCKRNETQGIPIGSATSNICLEIILGKIDKELNDAGYNFHRYIDDYNCYCETSEQAHQFLLLLAKLLSQYKLSLNIQKTQIIEQPSPDQDAWILELLGNLPSRLNKAHDDEPSLTASEAITFINHALKVNRQTPDGSVLKYAIQLIVNFLDKQATSTVYSSVLNLSWHYPILIPYLDFLIDKSNINKQDIDNQMNTLIIENCKHRRSDGICWPLHILKKQEIAPSNEAIDAIVDSEDCVAITILNSMLIGNQQIINFADRVIQTNDNYYIDTYWLLLYQLYREGEIRNPYDTIRIFDILRDNDVNFIPYEGINEAERYCLSIKAGFEFGSINELIDEEPAF